MQDFETIKRNMLPACLRNSMFVGECLLIYGDRNGLEIAATVGIIEPVGIPIVVAHLKPFTATRTGIGTSPHPMGTPRSATGLIVGPRGTTAAKTTVVGPSCTVTTGTAVVPIGTIEARAIVFPVGTIAATAAVVGPI